MYEVVAFAVGGLHALASIVILIVIPVAMLAVAYVDDRKHVSVPNWWKPLAVISPMNMFEADFIYGTNYSQSRFDYGELIMALIVSLVASVLVGVLWPVAIIVFGIWGTMFLLRLIARLGKKVSKIAKVAHTHPESVKFTRESI